MINTNLAQAVDATSDSGPAYDTNVKYLLADKQILSRILKYTVEEFRDLDIADIMDCIGDDIEIGTRPVDAGLSRLGRVKGTITEDNVPGEGIIYYDIRFSAYHKDSEMKILINIEAQKSSNPSKLGSGSVWITKKRKIPSRKSALTEKRFLEIRKILPPWI